MSCSFGRHCAFPAEGVAIRSGIDGMPRIATIHAVYSAESRLGRRWIADGVGDHLEKVGQSVPEDLEEAIDQSMLNIPFNIKFNITIFVISATPTGRQPAAF